MKLLATFLLAMSLSFNVNANKAESAFFSAEQIYQMLSKEDKFLYGAMYVASVSDSINKVLCTPKNITVQDLGQFIRIKMKEYSVEQRSNTAAHVGIGMLLVKHFGCGEQV